MKATLALTLVALALTTASAFATPATVTDTASVRNAPSVDSDIIGRAWPGMDVDITYCTDDDIWCLIGDTGWIRSSALEYDWVAEAPAALLLTPPSANPDPGYAYGMPAYTAPAFAPTLRAPDMTGMFDHKGCVRSAVAVMCL